MSAPAPLPESPPAESPPEGQQPPPQPLCPNCGEPAPGRYCAGCGQKQGELRPTLADLLQDFSRYLFRVDSRLLRTLRWLLIPGRLTLEYLRGRRESYERPFRLFLVINVIYFLAVSLQVDARYEKDGALVMGPGIQVEVEAPPVEIEPSPASADTPPSWEQRLEQRVNERLKLFDSKGSSSLGQSFWATWVRYGTHVYALLAPVYAALFMLLYRRHDFRYAEHFIFCLHYLSFSQLMALLLTPLPWDSALPWQPLLNGGYLLLALRDVYKASWWGTLWRWGLGWLLTLLLQALALIAILLYVLLWQ